jgi:hypothetical protein
MASFCWSPLGKVKGPAVGLACLQPVFGHYLLWVQLKFLLDLRSLVHSLCAASISAVLGEAIWSQKMSLEVISEDRSLPPSLQLFQGGGNEAKLTWEDIETLKFFSRRVREAKYTADTCAYSIHHWWKKSPKPWNKCCSDKITKGVYPTSQVFLSLTHHLFAPPYSACTLK